MPFTSKFATRLDQTELIPSLPTQQPPPSSLCPSHDLQPFHIQKPNLTMVPQHLLVNQIRHRPVTVISHKPGFRGPHLIIRLAQPIGARRSTRRRPPDTSRSHPARERKVMPRLVRSAGVGVNQLARRRAVAAAVEDVRLESRPGGRGRAHAGLGAR